MLRYLLALLFVSGLLSGCSNQKTADLIILNGKVWISEPNAFAEAIAIKGNIIIAVGTNTEVKRYANKDTQTIDAKGRLLTPGFNDAHIHFLNGSIGLSEVQLVDATTFQEVATIIKKYAEENPTKKWITGRGWHYTMFPDGLPTKEFLDTLNIDKPIYLRAYDGHSAVVNSKALEEANITSQYKFSGYGAVLVDEKGIPTGALTEGAQFIVGKIVPPPTETEKLDALRKGMKLAATLGITTIQNASGSPEEFSLFSQLYKNKELTLRTSTAFSVNENTTIDQINRYIKIKDSISTNYYIRANAIKFMLDGVIESHTAGMLERYSDVDEHSPSPKGNLSMTLERYNELVTLFDNNGFQIYTHAIGDLAVRESLNAYEHAGKINNTNDTRHRVEHIEIISSDDIPRFASLGILPSMEPIHAEPNSIAVWANAVGEQRLPNSFAWAYFIKSGANLVFSSDWPACASINPIRGLHVAVNRKSTDGQPPQGWVPEQKISIHDALYAYTYGGSYSSHDENIKGKIATGQLADIIMFSQNLFEIDPLKIHETKVLLTIFDGKVIYKSEEL